MKMSSIPLYIQSAFVGAMLAVCNIKFSDWRFLVLLSGNIILTNVYGALTKKEK